MTKKNCNIKLRWKVLESESQGTSTRQKIAKNGGGGRWQKKIMRRSWQHRREWCSCNGHIGSIRWKILDTWRTCVPIASDGVATETPEINMFILRKTTILALGRACDTEESQNTRPKIKSSKLIRQLSLYQKVLSDKAKTSVLKWCHKLSQFCDYRNLVNAKIVLALRNFAFFHWQR